MQFTAAAVLALAASASAAYTNGTVVYTTEVHTAYTTVCPAATELTFNGVTYTATESTTLTITNCPCTVVKPVTTSSYVAPTHTPEAPAPVYPTANGTAPVVTPVAPVTPVVPTKSAVGTTSAYVTGAKPTPSTITANGAERLALSGASLAGLLGVAAFVL